MGDILNNRVQAQALLRASIEQGNIEVPVLPETAHRVMGLIQSPDSDAAQLATIIQSDPTMGGHVMRIANSAAYTPNSNLVSLQQAIARLGMVEISNIAFSTSLNSKMFHAPGYEKHIALIWQHALASALWSKEIARAIRSNVEAAFLCGLLHTIGQPVILQTLADLSAVRNQLTDEELDILFDEFEADYCQKVSSEWGLPEIVCEAIGHYRHYQNTPNEPELAAIVAFGHKLANHTLLSDQQDIDELKQSEALEFINLYPDEVDRLLEKEPVIKSSMNAMLT